MSLAECIAFARQLPQFVAAGAEALAIPHLGTCANCAERFSAAVRVAAVLRVRPPAPAELASEAFFERILERAGQADSRMGAAIRAAMAPLRAPDSADLPSLHESPIAAAIGLGVAVPPNGSWQLQHVWTSVRDDLRREVAVQLRVRSRFRRAVQLTAIAAAVIVVYFGFRGGFSGGDGTLRESDIVFRDDALMPIIELSPASVLRRGGVG